MRACPTIRTPGSAITGEGRERPTAGTIVRRAARVILLDPDDRVLLLRFLDPRSGAMLWITPGGALEANETHEQAALRELAEETGLRDVPLGPCLGEVEHRFRWNGQAYEQRDRFYAARITNVPELSAPGLEAGELLVAAAWWSADELAMSAEEVSPPDLGSRLELASLAAPRKAR